MKRSIVSFWLAVVCLATRGQTGPLLSSPQQAVLLEEAGSFYYVVKFATIDLDSSIIVASRSLGISLLPLMTEAIPEEIPAVLSSWVGRADPTKGKNELPTLKGMEHLQQLYLLGSWYAFQSTAHPGGMDSAIGYLTRARAEAAQLDAVPWARRCACLLGKAYLGKRDTVSGNTWLRRTIDECRQATDGQGEAMAWRYWGVYFPLLPELATERIQYLKKAGELYLARKDDRSRINVDRKSVV